MYFSTRLLPLLLICLALLASSAYGQTTKECCEKDEPRTLSVQGMGKVSVKPDVAYLSFATQARGKTATEAYKDHQEKILAILTALKTGPSSIEAKDLQTQGMSVQPRYRYNRTDNKQIFEYYEVTQQLTVTVRDTEKVSSVLDSAVKLGANVNNINFTVEDSDSAAADASKKAYINIKSKAENIALSLGVTLGKPISIHDNGGNSYAPMQQNMHVHSKMMRGGPEMMMADAMEDGGGPPSVESGEVTVTHSVSITYEVH